MDKSTKKLQIGLWSIVAALVVGLCCMWYYQAHHFNKNVTINGISVGKMTAKDAADHLKNVTLDNTVYVGNDVMYRGQKTSAGFSSKDDGKIEAILKKQFTFVPSSVQKNYEVAPSNVSDYRKKELKKKVKDALTKANLKRKAAIDAYAVMKDGKVSVVPAEKGTQYDVPKIMKEYDKHLADSTLHLKEKILQPLAASSKVVQAEKQKLDSLAKKETTYNVQGKTYEMKAAELLNSARVINGRYSYDDTGLRNKIDDSQRSTSRWRLKRPAEARLAFRPGLMAGKSARMMRSTALKLLGKTAPKKSRPKKTFMAKDTILTERAMRRRKTAASAEHMPKFRFRNKRSGCTKTVSRFIQRTA